MRASRICAALLAALWLLPAAAQAEALQREIWIPLPETTVQELARAALTQATGIEDLQIELDEQAAWITADTRYWGAAHRLSMRVNITAAYAGARGVQLTLEVLQEPKLEARSFMGWLTRRAARRAIRRMAERHDPPELPGEPVAMLRVDWPLLQLRSATGPDWDRLKIPPGLVIDGVRLRDELLELHCSVDPSQLLRWLLPR